MRQLSSNWTLGFRVFFPTLWLTFFISFLVAIIATDKNEIGAMSINGLRVGLIIFIGIFYLIFSKTLFRLKRVDATNEFFYVTNYFPYKTVRYKHGDVVRIEVSKGNFFTFGTLVLKEKASFGDRILFFLSKKRLEMFLEENPNLRAIVQEFA